MNTKLLIPLMLGVAVSLPAAGPLDSAFTYQGHLTEGGQPANGLYDLTFQGYTNATLGPPIGSAVTNLAVSVSNGLFTTLVDFGGKATDNPGYWLELGVRTNGGGDFVVLTPRQPLTAAPFAWYADLAAWATTASNVAPLAVTGAGIVPAALTGDHLADGQVVRSLNDLRDAVSLVAGTNVSIGVSGNSLQISATPGTVVTNAGWSLTGNSGTGPNNFLGTLDGQPLEFRVNYGRVLRLESPAVNKVNIVGGYAGNAIAAGVGGATIAGGGGRGILGPTPNTIASDFAAIGGGVRNTVQSNASSAVIAGGGANVIQSGASFSTIAGGSWQTVETNAVAAAISGGERNTIQGNAHHATIGGGSNNVVLAMASGATISGGHDNVVEAEQGTIAGGYHNAVSAYNAVVAGGRDNAARGSMSTVGGGLGNVAGGDYSTVPGGLGNTAQGYISLAAGYRAKALHRGSFVWSDRSLTEDFSSAGDNTFNLRAAGGVQFHPATSLYFGYGVRQMLNLYGTQYGFGVQGYTLYFRTDDRFAWYRGGVHSDTANDPGVGGTALMTLGSAGNLEVRALGSAVAVRGMSSGDASIGVQGMASGDASIGVWGQASGSEAVGVYGRSTLGKAGYFDGIVEIRADSWVDRPHLRLAETGADDYARLEFRSGSHPYWHIAVGGPQNQMNFYNSTNGDVMSLSQDGTLYTKVLTITGGSDVAEPFPMSSRDIPKGAVVIIDEQNPGQLKLSERPYDTRVAGIVSGANGVKPGLTLSQQGVLDGGQQVALTGRVYALADATQTAIKPGDLLTTSSTPGHAMKVTDPAQAQGAILGKAMSALPEGTGLVLVLVSLQ